MFKNYIKIAIRNLFKHKIYSLINISGLTIGMTCCILILLFVQDELSYDRYHEKAGQIYRVERKGNFQGMDYQTSTTAHPFGPALVRDFPEIEDKVRLWPVELSVRDFNMQFTEERIFFSDASLFEVFSFSLKKGNPKTALTEPNSIVLTEKMAARYFADIEPMGKTLNVAWDDSLLNLKVTGILSDLPQNSHFKTDFFASYGTLNTLLDGQLEAWVSNSIKTYLLLSKEVSIPALEAKFPDFLEKYMGNQARQILGENADLNKLVRLILRPITDIHLYADLQHEIEANGSIATVYVFSAIAVLILIIAAINFMNLATARSGGRAREVGLRKVVGANRSLLIKQFLGESVLLAFIALFLAILLAELALPYYNAFTLKNLAIDYFGNPSVILGLTGIVLFIGIFAGLYPAFFLSSFQPIMVLKGTFNAKTKGKSSFLREGLVVLQFSISLVLIISTIIVSNQLDFVKNKELGFNKEQVVVVPILDSALPEKLDVIKAELKQNASVLSVAASSKFPGSPGFSDTVWRRDGGEGDDFIIIQQFTVDHDYLSTIGTEMIAGRFFDKKYITDADAGVILNESAVKDLGWTSVDEAVGKNVEFPIGINPPTYGKAEVIGVVQNFHFKSLHQKIEPLVLHMGLNDRFSTVGFLSARISSNDVAGTVSFMEEKWQQFSPNFPFEYSFLDEKFDSHYRAEQRMQNIFSYFTGLAIFVSCLGLLGLASFTAEQRTKEIGIRKVLGASESNVVLLLSREFVKLVAIANIIAWPVAYLAMNNWLEDFAYRTSITVGTFVLAGLLVLVFAILTVSFQAIKAATANPVDALQYE